MVQKNKSDLKGNDADISSAKVGAPRPAREKIDIPEGNAVANETDDPARMEEIRRETQRWYER